MSDLKFNLLNSTQNGRESNYNYGTLSNGDNSINIEADNFPSVSRTYLKDNINRSHRVSASQILVDIANAEKGIEDLLAELRTTKCNRYIFNKNKYLPSAYLPGDGNDFLTGYKKEPIQNKTEVGQSNFTVPNTKYYSSIGYCSETRQMHYDNINGIYSYNLTNNNPWPYCPPLNTSQYCSVINHTGENNKASLDNKAISSQNYQSHINYVSSDFLNSQFLTESDSAKSQLHKCGKDKEPSLLLSSSTSKINTLQHNTSQRKKISKTRCPYFNEKGEKIKKNKKSNNHSQSSSCNSELCHFGKMHSKTSKTSKTNSKSICTNPECPFKLQQEECTEQNCTFAKEVVICQDCGGILTGEIEITDQFKVEQSNTNDQKYHRKDSRRFSLNPESSSIAEQNSMNINNSSAPKKPRKKLKKKKKQKEYFYLYLGTILGHKNCYVKNKRVPKDMGWLWTSNETYPDPQYWRGYKPGAISRKVYRRIINHRQMLGITESRSDVKFSRRKSKVVKEKIVDKNKRYFSLVKKDGNYLITINPVKDPKTTKYLENPYMDCTPLQFKIIKEKKAREPNNDCVCCCNEETKEEYDSSSGMDDFECSFSPPCALPNIVTQKNKSQRDVETQAEVEEEQNKSKKKK